LPFRERPGLAADKPNQRKISPETARAAHPQQTLAKNSCRGRDCRAGRMVLSRHLEIFYAQIVTTLKGRAPLLMRALAQYLERVVVNKSEKKSACLSEKHDQLRKELDFFRRELPQAPCMQRDVATVLEFIHSHIFESSLNVNRVKHGCRIKNNNISTRFRIVLGIGIREFIERLRLFAASRLLQERRFEIYLIAMAVGYEYQETFCRAFRRHFGYPPSDCLES
jgi:AraC-like DNA-binding protein